MADPIIRASTTPRPAASAPEQPAATPAPSPAQVAQQVGELRLLRLGALGSETTQHTQKAQQFLLETGLLQQGTFTPGTFDTATENAVKAWQTQNQLQVDGIIGQQTWGSFLGARLEPGVEMTKGQGVAEGWGRAASEAAPSAKPASVGASDFTPAAAPSEPAAAAPASAEVKPDEVLASNSKGEVLATDDGRPVATDATTGKATAILKPDGSRPPNGTTDSETAQWAADGKTASQGLGAFLLQRTWGLKDRVLKKNFERATTAAQARAARAGGAAQTFKRAHADVVKLSHLPGATRDMVVTAELKEGFAARNLAAAKAAASAAGKAAASAQVKMNAERNLKAAKADLKSGLSTLKQDSATAKKTLTAEYKAKVAAAKGKPPAGPGLVAKGTDTVKQLAQSGASSLSKLVPASVANAASSVTSGLGNLKFGGVKVLAVKTTEAAHKLVPSFAATFALKFSQRLTTALPYAGGVVALGFAASDGVHAAKTLNDDTVPVGKTALASLTALGSTVALAGHAAEVIPVLGNVISAGFAFTGALVSAGAGTVEEALYPDA
jgi:Putative peptidoglycan binding domain